MVTYFVLFSLLNHVSKRFELTDTTQTIIWKVKFEIHNGCFICNIYHSKETRNNGKIISSMRFFLFLSIKKYLSGRLLVYNNRWNLLFISVCWVYPKYLKQELSRDNPARLKTCLAIIMDMMVILVMWPGTVEEILLASRRISYIWFHLGI